MTEPVGEPISDDLPCPNCGYNLRALTTRRCPECGEAFDPHRVRRAQPPVLVSLWVEMGLGSLGLALAYPCSCAASVTLVLNPFAKQPGPTRIWLGLALGLAALPILIVAAYHARRLRRLHLTRSRSVPRSMQNRAEPAMTWLMFFSIETLLSLAILLVLAGGFGLVLG